LSDASLFLAVGFCPSNEEGPAIFNSAAKISSNRGQKSTGTGGERLKEK
jgi:hypothetical protein